jgi:hypothetical protein
MAMLSTGGFSGLSFHLECPQGVASVLFKKTLTFVSRSSKLDHLTVRRWVLPALFVVLVELSNWR